MSISNNNQFEIPLKLSKILEESGTIQKFVIDPNDKYVKLRLNSKYNPVISLDVSTEVIKEKDGWTRFTNKFRNELKPYKIDKNHENWIVSNVTDNGELIRSIARSTTNDNHHNNSATNSCNQQQQNDLGDVISDQEEKSNTENNNEKEIIKIVSVSQALRMHSGKVNVKGTIIGISKLYKMISKISLYCDTCSKDNEYNFNSFPISNTIGFSRRCKSCTRKIKAIQDDTISDIEHKNAVKIELQDIENFNDMDRLSVILFDKDTEDVTAGDTVVVNGEIHIINEINNKKQIPYLYTSSIIYLNKDNLILTKLDVEAIKKLVKINRNNKIIDQLVSMFDPSVVGYEYVKKGLLMSAVNTSEITSKKEKIHSVLIGDPGLAKSQLLKRTTQLIPNSNYVSAQNTSGKRITAIIDKTDENLFLRLGSIPQARGAISGLNELGRMSLEDQGHILDVMQEEEFTKSAYGFTTKIPSPTTIIASANPVNNSKWKDNDKIDLSEFPLLTPLIDRFDLKFPFRDRKDPEEIKIFGKKYSETLTKLEQGLLPDYTVMLIKYLEYARQLKPIISQEAKTMLEDFYINVKIKGFGSDRVLPSLRKIAKAIARLKLKDIVDEYDAKEAMEYYNVMLLNFQKQVIISESPPEIVYNECVSSLKQQKNFGGIAFEDMLKEVCKNNEQCADYLEYPRKSLQIKNNRKTRKICYKLLNNSHIKKVNEHPIILKWFDDNNNDKDNDSVGDLGDLGDIDKTLNEKNFDKKTEFFNENGQAPVSPTSLTSPRNNEDQKDLEFVKRVQFHPKGEIHEVSNELYKKLKQEEAERGAEI
ncbi:MAG TPA: AAA family ATPase [Nitrososphaeraceae archaeon]|nr:AAA family ATPase [Nitrososphaeraceae archaeon]